MSSFEISRSAHIEADPARVHDLVADLHQWTTWSPWEGLDPELRRSYGGPARGVGATYRWDGNRKAGAGSMAITGDTPERVDISLTFEKPFKAVNDTVFVLDATPDGATDVTWTMRGERTGLMGVLSKVVPFDKIVGRDFERGLARLGESARA